MGSTGMTGCYSIYGFEYKPAREWGTDNITSSVSWQGSISGYITWVNDGAEAWTMRAPGRSSRFSGSSVLTNSNGPQCSSYGRPASDLRGTNVYNHQSRYFRELRGCRVRYSRITELINSYDGLEELWPVQYVLVSLYISMRLISSMDIDYIRVYRMSPVWKIDRADLV